MRRVSFPTFSPFVLKDVLRPRVRRKTIEGIGYLFEPPGLTPAQNLPAVVVMEGLGGIKDCREMAYGEQLAAWGYVALVVDSFGARGAEGYGHTKRAIHVTESMMLADAYAALRFLSGHPQVDASRVAVMGFSYGGMISVLSAYEQVRGLFAEDGLRFAAHASYYGCSVARFDRVETTGAPVMILLGELDENVSIRRSREIAADLRRGGSPVTVKVYPETFHQWDSDDYELRHVGLSLCNVRFQVEPDHTVRDAFSGMAVAGPVSRTLLIGLNVSRCGYGILRSEQAKAWSDSDLAEFLHESIGGADALARRPGQRGDDRRSASA